MQNRRIYIVLLSLSLIFLISGVINAAPDFKLIYVIQQGDSLYEIARDYDISVEKLCQVNNLNQDSWIKVGDELIIPQIKAEKEDENWENRLFADRQNNKKEILSIAEPVTYSVRVNKNKEIPEVNIPPGQIITYHIGVGDTLFELARDFNTSIGVVMALNDMENSIIRIGDKLQLPINNLTARQVLARTVSDQDLNLLARVIYGEARGEPFIGQVAVGAVVINRVLSSYFPDTFRRVIYQSGQFTAVSDGQINLNPGRTAYRAARDAVRGKDPTMGALYYYNPDIAENKWWFSTRKLLVTIGDHVFAR